MKTKRIILSTCDYDTHKLAEGRIKEYGMDISKIRYNTEFKRYDIIVKVTKEQAYMLLDLATEIGAILWKGER